MSSKRAARGVDKRYQEERNSQTDLHISSSNENWKTGHSSSQSQLLDLKPARGNVPRCWPRAAAGRGRYAPQTAIRGVLLVPPVGACGGCGACDACVGGAIFYSFIFTYAVPR